jgi:hypothetical protein
MPLPCQVVSRPKMGAPHPDATARVRGGCYLPGLAITGRGQEQALPCFASARKSGSPRRTMLAPEHVSTTTRKPMTLSE